MESTHHFNFSFIQFVFIFLIVIQNITDVHGRCDTVIQVENQNDLSALKNCPIFSGTISVISTRLKTLTIPYIKELHGTIHVQNNLQLESISIPNLSNANDIVLNDNAALATVEVPSLSKANTFTIHGAPSLESVRFVSGLSEINNFELSHTGVSELTGLVASSVGALRLMNNENIAKVSLPNLVSVKTIDLYSNSNSGLHFAAPNLENFGEGVFRNLASASLPSLKKVASDLCFNENKMDMLSIPKLEDIGKTLIIAKNENLKSTFFPNLSHVGGLLLQNNPKLTEIEGFKSLNKVDKSVDITGNFSKLTLSKVQDINGGLNVQSSSSEFSCNEINELKEKNIVKGKDFVCKSGVKDPKPLGNSKDSDDKTKDKNNTTKTEIHPSPTGKLQKNEAGHNGIGRINIVKFILGFVVERISKWTHKHLNDDWNQTIFRDETTFCLFRNTIERWYRDLRLTHGLPKD
ncbi:hypothetical protein G9A89_020259 [Geosiphon pyriformis]|nr:hypothetical protein G9A89_020259 [Geosiphon pyriformis]